MFFSDMDELYLCDLFPSQILIEVVYPMIFAL